MSRETQELVAFRLTGKRPLHIGEDEAASPDSGGHSLRPVLFAGYSDLSALRYDFPLLLVDKADLGSPVISLTDLMNRVDRAVAPHGPEGEFERGHLLALESRIRVHASRLAQPTLMGCWKKAQADLLKDVKGKERKDLKALLEETRRQVGVDGLLVDCNGKTAQRVLEHIWRIELEERSATFRERVGALIIRLERILEADFEISGEAQDSESLEHSVGDTLASSFDFKVLSDLLKSSDTHDQLPATRVERIGRVLATLKNQRFFATSYLASDERSAEVRTDGVYPYIFKDSTKAHDAFLDRLPEMVQVVMSIAIAELEIENGYQPDFHDDYFGTFDQTSLVPEDLDMFPSYLALCKGQPWSTAEKGRIIETLSSGLPIKILVQIDDIVPISALDAGAFARGPAAAQFANLAVGLGSSFVLQTSASNLYQLRKKLGTGLGAPGPALFSVFSGLGDAKAREADGKVSTYLTAAAAMESRAFPAFVFDPSHGDDLAHRFSLLNNPEGRVDWTSYALEVEDDDMQRTSVGMAFTFVDFVAGDGRYRHHFVKIPKKDWVSEMVSVGEYLTLTEDEAADSLPYVLMINERNEAARYVVDDLIVRAAEKIRDNWRSLQELGGVNNSHVVIRLEEERAQWEEEKEKEIAALKSELEASAQAVQAAQQAQATPAALAAAPAPVATEAAPAVEAPVAEAESAAPVEEAPAAAPPSDDPWIETARCTTCNECTDLNDMIFAYNDNMQAFIKDAEAGPYKDIIEAAENCQVAIIHPGKPKDPNEPGLDDLIKRAEPFL